MTRSRVVGSWLAARSRGHVSGLKTLLIAIACSVAAAELVASGAVLVQRALSVPGPPSDVSMPIAFLVWQGIWLFGSVGLLPVSFLFAVAALAIAGFRTTVDQPGRWAATRFISLAIAVPIGAVTFMFWPPHIDAEKAARRPGLVAAADSLAPLVAAIERYEREHGAPPPSLDHLVPGFLPALPPHPLRICRAIEYHQADGTGHRGRWELTMDCPNFGFMELDYFVFRPDGQYPPTFERIGRWAYHWD